MTEPGSLPAGYFEALYAAAPDPWDFEGSDYERGKYAATLAALPQPRYARALEVGCSIGVLTALLAPRCDRLLAVWDGLPSRGLGGTGDIVTYARTLGRPVTVIWRDGVLRG